MSTISTTHCLRYQQTFLCNHIHNELYPKSEPIPNARIREEILALENLRYRLKQAFLRNPAAEDSDLDAAIHANVTIADFFYNPVNGMHEYPLYMPIRISRQRSPRNTDVPGIWNELTDLLADDRVKERGVVLRTRSGAGKTTAMLKAFFDCFYPEAAPPLKKYLPCYLRDLTFASKLLSAVGGVNSLDDVRLVEALILQAGGWSGKHRSTVRDWLGYSQPLILFLDLNTAAEPVACRLSIALPKFLQEYKQHRFIIGYRSFGEDKISLNLSGENCAFYDLEPLHPHNAGEYLRRLSAYEERLRTTIANTVDRSPRADVEEYDVPSLQRMISQHTRGNDSVLSTPLLMHLFSLLRGEDQRRVHSLSHLYQEVVEEYLDREYLDRDSAERSGRKRIMNEIYQDTPHQKELIDTGGMQDSAGRVRLKVALVRVALAILGQKSGTEVRLLAREDGSSENVLDTLLQNPDAIQDWWPKDSWWHTGDYYKIHFEDTELRSIKMLSLLRLDGATYGFLHDSFLYYFAALAIRCRLRPIVGVSPANDEWIRKATDRMHQDPEHWRLPAEFLGGNLDYKQLRALVVRILVAAPKFDLVKLVLQILRGRQIELCPGDNGIPVRRDDPILTRMEDVLRANTAELSRFPEAVFPQVYHCMKWSTNWSEECRRFADEVLSRAMRRCWLRTTSANTNWPPRSINCGCRPLCVALTPNGEFVTGHGDGTVRRWGKGIESGSILYRHQKPTNTSDLYSNLPHGDNQVRAVGVRPDGTILSISMYGEILQWEEGQSTPILLYQHSIEDDMVVSAAVNTKQATVIFRGFRAVYQWRKGDRETQIVYDSEGTYRGAEAVGVDERNGAVLFAVPHNDSEVSILRWNNGVLDRTPHVFDRDTLRFWGCFVVDPRDDSILLNTSKGIARWGVDDSCATLHGTSSPVLCIAVDPGTGRLIYGSADTLLKSTDCLFKSNEDEEPTKTATAWTLDERDGSLIEGTIDGKIFRRKSFEENPCLLFRLPPGMSVVYLAHDNESGAVVVATRGGQLLRWSETDGSHIVLAKGLEGKLYRPLISNGTVFWAVRWRECRIDDFMFGGIQALHRPQGTTLYRWHDGTIQQLHIGTQYELAGAVLNGMDGTVYIALQPDITQNIDAKLFGPTSGIVRWNRDATTIEKEVVWAGRSSNELVTAVCTDHSTGLVYWGNTTGGIFSCKMEDEHPTKVWQLDGPIVGIALDQKTSSVCSFSYSGQVALRPRVSDDMVVIVGLPPADKGFWHLECNLDARRITLVYPDRIMVLRLENLC